MNEKSSFVEAVTTPAFVSTMCATLLQWEGNRRTRLQAQCPVESLPT